jgi:hypothetical protein
MDPTHNRAAEIQAATCSGRNMNGNIEQLRVAEVKERQHGVAEITEWHHKAAETKESSSTLHQVTATLTGRQSNFMISQNNNYKIGNSFIGNRLALLNYKIPLSWLSLTIKSFKVKCKKRFP